MSGAVFSLNGRPVAIEDHDGPVVTLAYFEDTDERLTTREMDALGEKYADDLLCGENVRPEIIGDRWAETSAKIRAQMANERGEK